MKNRKIIHEVDLSHLVPPMPPDRGMIQYQWEVTEDLQDNMPYFEWGWHGYVPMILFRGLVDEA